ncbi:hypothetical protein MTR_1g111800 [Medicago truncatula]|uniref:Uncharacterized protein n=1 Tax=Medicago truncatula TaxID=3880 RepID=A0A072VRI2_MEDTR|nr:hypothetical protein MTR_1g111800 [Medicago truncatula]
MGFDFSLENKDRWLDSAARKKMLKEFRGHSGIEGKVKHKEAADSVVTSRKA